MMTLAQTLAELGFSEKQARLHGDMLAGLAARLGVLRDSIAVLESFLAQEAPSTQNHVRAAGLTITAGILTEELRLALLSVNQYVEVVRAATSKEKPRDPESSTVH